MTRDALLLLGPTGVGKSPLGDLLEREGLWGRPCRHFDFGSRLRAVASGALRPDGLDEAQVGEIRVALDTGALLTDAQLPIALAILDDFLGSSAAGSDSLVVLNGLPRHEGQAVGIESRVAVRWVACLEVPPQVLHERIRMDAGGDRAGRVDDDPEAVERRLERFRARTRPLVAYYGARGARIVPIEIGSASTARDARTALARG